jgi:hypothetical protein
MRQSVRQLHEPCREPGRLRRADLPRTAHHRVSRQRRCSQAGALRWQGQIARATRGRDLHLNVPLPRKPPDLLMAESPPTGGLSAFNELSTPCRPALARRPPCSIRLKSDSLSIDARGAGRDVPPKEGPRLAEHQSAEPVPFTLERERGSRRAANQGRMSFSVAVNRSPDSSSSPSMWRRAGPVSVHRSRK